MYQLQYQVERLPRQDFDRVIVLGDFNLDQKSPQHRDCFIPFCEYFEFIQCSTWSTHRWGGILDLAFDTDQSKQPVDWMPSPYSEHFYRIVSTIRINDKQTKIRIPIFMENLIVQYANVDKLRKE